MSGYVVLSLAWYKEEERGDIHKMERERERLRSGMVLDEREKFLAK